MGAHGVGIHVDLIFLYEAANRGHFADAFGREQSVAHVPVLRAADLIEIPAAGGIALRIAAFDGVPVNLPKGGGVGAQRGLNAGGQGSGGQAVQLFEDA